jgi:hypothetical protein
MVSKLRFCFFGVGSGMRDVWLQHWFLLEVGKFFTYKEIYTFSLVSKKINQIFNPLKMNVLIALPQIFERMLLKSRVDLVLRVFFFFL